MYTHGVPKLRKTSAGVCDVCVVVCVMVCVMYVLWDMYVLLCVFFNGERFPCYLVDLGLVLYCTQSFLSVISTSVSSQILLCSTIQ